MTIERLLKVAPPTAVPREAFSGRWELIEAFLGVSLPQDYKDFARLYGLGEFIEFLGVYIPGCSSPYMRLEAEASAVADMFRALEEFSYPIWPDPGGLLACGKTNYGDYLLWRTDGPPEDWKVVFWDRGLGAFKPFDLDLTDFLAALASDELPPEFLSEDDGEIQRDRLFVPFSDRPQQSFNLNWRVSYGGSSAGAPGSEDEG